MTIFGKKGRTAVAFDELLHSLQASYDRSLKSISQAVQEAHGLGAEAASANGRVLVGISGDYGMSSVTITDEEFELRDPDGLADAVLSAYNNAGRLLRRQQRHTVLGSILNVESEKP